jgi:hypothetical protein
LRRRNPLFFYLKFLQQLLTSLYGIFFSMTRVEEFGEEV